VAPQIGDGVGAGTAQMGPIRNPGEGRRARMKASIRYVTLIDNIFQGIFTKRLFECELGGAKKHWQDYRNNAIIPERKDQLSREATIEYVELPNGRTPAREFVGSLDDKAAARAARIDAFIQRLRIHGHRMQGKFVKKLADDISADAGRE
jgi:hypothetical protein